MTFVGAEATGAANADWYPVGRVVFLVATNLVALWIGVIGPFRAGYREKPILNAVLRGWMGAILYMIALCILAPLTASMFDTRLEKEMLRSWVPEPPAIFGMLMIGWLLPLVSASAGAFVGAARRG